MPSYYPMLFDPIYKDYIWGGRNLSRFGKQLPAGIVAESWEIASHPDGSSRVANGRYASLTLDDLLYTLGPGLTGTAASGELPGTFPLLVKWIDANDRLSVQVHPPDAYARAAGHPYGKTEAWYIAEAAPGARLLYGLKPGVRREDFEKAASDGTLAETLRAVLVRAGEVYDIPAGLVHAIGEGIILVEIQQNSNLTYRVYDYDRVDASGRARPLHLREALDVIRFGDAAGQAVPGLEIHESDTLVRRIYLANRYFALEKHSLRAPAAKAVRYETRRGRNSRFMLFVVLKGSCHFRSEYAVADETVTAEKGRSLLLPAGMGTCLAYGTAEMIVSYIPSSIRTDILAPLEAAGYPLSLIRERIALP